MNPRFPTAAFTLASAVMVFALVLQAALWASYAERARESELERAELERLRADIVLLDEVLTMSAHMAAATGAPTWEVRYRENEPRLRAALARGLELAPDPDGTVATAAANEDLVEMEERALAFARAGDLDQASQILHAPTYTERKSAFAYGVSHLVDRLDRARAASSVRQTWVSLGLGGVGLVGLVAAILAWVLAFRAVRRWRGRMEELQTDLTGARAALLSANANLEEQVAERSKLAESRADEVARLAHELVAVEALERQKLARILHDHLQQILVGAKLQIGLAREMPQAPPACGRADQFLDEAIQVSRSLAAQLDPPVDLNHDLAEALRWLASWMEDTHGLQVHLAVGEAPDGLSPEVRGLALHAARELLFNVVKHAQVGEAEVAVSRHDDTWTRLRVRDAGVGFVPRPDRPMVGLGLSGMVRRVRSLGGRMAVHAAPGEGVDAILDLPAAFGPARGAPTPVPPPGHIPPPPGRLAVLLVDDHPVVREGISARIEREADLRLVGAVADEAGANEALQRGRVDVLVVDLSLASGPLAGVELIRAVRCGWPSVRIIALSTHGGAAAEAAKRAGPPDLSRRGMTPPSCSRRFAARVDPFRVSSGDARPRCRRT